MTKRESEEKERAEPDCSLNMPETELPTTHPCYKCPIVQMFGGKPYCFLPRCMRKEMEDSLKKKKHK